MPKSLDKCGFLRPGVFIPGAGIFSKGDFYEKDQIKGYWDFG